MKDLFGNEIEEAPSPVRSQPSKPVSRPKPADASAEYAPVRNRTYTFWREGNVTTIWFDDAGID